MNIDLNNKKYWRKISAKAIIGRNALPGNELIDVLPKGSSVLDLGCGTGEVAEFLSGKAYRVTGIDLNIEAISQNKSKTTKVNYILGDVTVSLPFLSQSFDAIVISFLLVNIISPIIREKLVSELTRVLKPGAYIWLNEGLVSEDYIKRYKLSKPFVSDEHSFFVFKDGTLATSVQTQNQLIKAIKERKTLRVAHHFTVAELKKLFNKYTVIYEKETQTRSPNTKSIIKMIIMVLRLQ